MPHVGENTSVFMGNLARLQCPIRLEEPVCSWSHWDLWGVSQASLIARFLYAVQAFLRFVNDRLDVIFLGNAKSTPCYIAGCLSSSFEHVPVLLILRNLSFSTVPCQVRSMFYILVIICGNVHITSRTLPSLDNGDRCSWMFTRGMCNLCMH